MNEKQRKLIELLKEMFQLNQTDLDFGIYRIMNKKSDEINQFLEKDLIKSIKEAFNSNNNDSLQKELEDKISSFKNDGFTEEQIENNQKIKELKDKLAASSNKENDENEIYSFLTNFFSRYYKDGDFVSLRRYKKDTYSIPYEGEEVKLHWANADQYYIKTSEYFRDYTFVINDKKFHFKIVDADTEKNNNKADSDKERRFIIADENPVYEENGEIFIRFEYKPIGKEAQTKINENTIKVILSSDESLIGLLKEKAPTEKNKDRTILEKHLVDYTSRNSFDYFIHKDLKGFLSRELDFYIKNEILFIDDILESTTSKIENSLNKVKTFKKIGNKIIAFLSQLEDFQKKLWLKKKFIVDTNYCITLDKIDESFYASILENEEQLKEWKELFGVDLKSIEDLKAEKFLVLDTKFFSSEFKDKLLNEFEDLDEQCDGVLINSENFGALNLLQERYKEQVKTVYIDPPYNTGNDGFLYNDTYQHSSWMSFMYDRLALSKELMNKNGVIFSSIGDEEHINLDLLKQSIFGKQNRIDTSARISKTASNLGTHFASSIDYLLTFSKDIKNLESFRDEVDSSLYKKTESEGIRKGEKYRDDIALYQSSLKDLRPGQKYFIDCPDGTKVIPPCKILDEVQREGEKRWRWTKDKYLKSKHLLVFKETSSSPLLDENGNQSKWNIYTKSYLLDRQEDGIKPRNFLDKYINRKGADLIKKLGIDFSFSKPIELIDFLLKITETKTYIMDYFSGSGTTGHATINLNREDNGKRKYILVEMGNYFDSVLKPRIQKVIYTDNWKEGKPQDKNGISQIFKYFKLESYEDTLNNLAFKEPNKSLFDDNVKEDYLLNYMLDYETNESLLNIDSFKNPYDYKLKIASSSAGETIDTNIDLVETFNYLIGLKIKSRQKIKGFLTIEGENLKEEKILIIWRNGQTNQELNEFFSKQDYSVHDREFDTIYVNGDNNLANLKKDEEHFKVKLIEEEFKLKMFGE